MANLLKFQIHDSCKLAMPDGLKELMSDISREVLRSQPENLYQFITDYLEALLEAREALSIACRICGEITNCSCYPELDYELRCVGLSSEDVIKAKNIIQEHFDNGQVKETNLLIKLAKMNSVTETQLRELKHAIRKAFQRHILKQKNLQVSFARVDESSTETSQGTRDSASSESSVSDFYKPDPPSSSNKDHSQIKNMFLPARYRQCKMSESATTLAGSFINLPATVPYSIHETVDGSPEEKDTCPSILNVLKSYIFMENGNDEHVSVSSRNNVCERKPTESEDIYDTISNIEQFFESRSNNTLVSRTESSISESSDGSS